MQELKEDVEAHCSNGNYKDKTVMFCWEHKNIPYIVARFGLTTDELTWGLDPFAGVGLLVAHHEPVTWLSMMNTEGRGTREALLSS